MAPTPADVDAYCKKFPQYEFEIREDAANPYDDDDEEEDDGPEPVAAIIERNKQRAQAHALAQIAASSPKRAR